MTKHPTPSLREHLGEQANRRFLAAWVGGSHLHGVADENSDIDLRLIVEPTPEEILFGKADWAKSFHDPDINVITPLRWMELLSQGAPTTVEALTLPADCVLFDSGLLAAFSERALDYTTGETRSIALRMAWAIQTKSARPDLTERQQHKLQAEAIRLCNGAKTIMHGKRAWPARDLSKTSQLIDIRANGIKPAKLRSQGFRMEALAKQHPLPALSEETRTRSEQTILDLYKNLVNQKPGESFGFDDIEKGLLRFQQNN